MQLQGWSPEDQTVEVDKKSTDTWNVDISHGVPAYNPQWNKGGL